MYNYNIIIGVTNMFKIKMIHVSGYPMLQHGGGANLPLCKPRSLLVKGRLI